MRILVASHTYITDINCEKLRAIAHLGTEVAIVVPRRWRPGGVQSGLIETQPRQEANLRIVPITNFSQNHQGLLSFGFDIVPLLQQFRPQIIQVEQGAKSIAYAQLITLNRLLGLKAKNLLFTWWNLPYVLKFPLSQLEAYNLRSTHGAIVGNQDAANILQQHEYEKAIAIIPQLGVDEQQFHPQPQPELAAKLCLNSTDFVVGFVGRFVKEKGLRTLVAALQLLDRSWKLLLIGRGELLPELREQLGDRLICVESVPQAEVPRYLNLMDVLVLPSETTAFWKEQFGHVLIEAMACHVPVIGSNSGEIPNVIGNAGLIFAEGNVAELRDRLLQMMQPNYAAEYAKRGFDRVHKHYTNSVLAQQQFTFYQQLLQS
ncbi:glycosyltransferase family 4 protein [Microcoleus sp. FACHB-1515]|uniref:hormogonium polysaccharide biosynthesis glycosyltransferase HpsO n=1 Tax=Cyanophyceae TaxID=3028117 RepID=UPI0016871FED|nr:hormogonium polysaccharide biosynthesis glycosyltransferase HpsO [Microcoleus sp. FACHB-1515]MBD2091355.1 glycosyltransferase family 4 protein [Microcoleus sp. FACHB-1515]